jgi:hypothetical protein
MGGHSFEYVTPKSDVSADLVAERLLLVIRSINSSVMLRYGLRDADVIWAEGAEEREVAHLTQNQRAQLAVADAVGDIVTAGPFESIVDIEIGISTGSRGAAGGGVLARFGGLFNIIFGWTYVEMPVANLRIDDDLGGNDTLSRAMNVPVTRHGPELGFGLALPIGKWVRLRGEAITFFHFGSISEQPAFSKEVEGDIDFSMIGISFNARLSVLIPDTSLGFAAFARINSTGFWEDGDLVTDIVYASGDTNYLALDGEYEWYATYGGSMFVVFD